VIVRAGRRGARLKSVPIVYATGKIAISVVSSGAPMISLIRCSFCSGAVTQVVPSPRARSARQKLHAAWITESNRLGRPLLSTAEDGWDHYRRRLGEVLGQMGRRSSTFSDADRVERNACDLRRSSQRSRRVLVMVSSSRGFVEGVR
jgi:hypothetical protein